jgi:hypothetical protein
MFVKLLTSRYNALMSAQLLTIEAYEQQNNNDSKDRHTNERPVEIPLSFEEALAALLKSDSCKV